MEEDNRSRGNIISNESKNLKLSANMKAINDLHPPCINILTKDYLERSCNFLNSHKIKEKNLIRVTEISKCIILK